MATIPDRKNMKNRKPPTKSVVAEWLQAKRIKLPPLGFRLRKIEPRYNREHPWDFELEGIWADQKARFAVEYKGLYTPQAFETALKQCLGTRLPSGIRPMMVLPYLGPDQLDQLESVGLSGIDLCGNGVVIIPESLRVFRTGAPNQFSTSAPIKNIYRKNTSMVARLFTTKPTFPNLQTICNEINARNPFVKNGSRTPMRLGTVSKALKGLTEDLIIERLRHCPFAASGEVAVATSRELRTATRNSEETNQNTIDGAKTVDPAR